MDFADNSKPIYLQIADAFFDKIMSGVFKDGDRIPSVREHAADIGVNPNTVARTYDFLSSNGVIFQKRGLGYFISDNAKEKVHAYLRDKFLGETMPRIRHMMDLLGITPQEAFGEDSQH